MGYEMGYELREKVADCFFRIRDARPLVHQISNYVSVNDQANITLAAGASPIMAEHPEELAEIMKNANSLLLNTGTINRDREAVLLQAARLASQYGLAVVLDPVGVAASSVRRELTYKILDTGCVNVIKGNLAEIKTLFKWSKEKVICSSGVDSFEEIQVKDEPGLSAILQGISREYNLVVAITGKEDILVKGERLLKLANGVPALQSISGSGCMTASLIASCLAVEEDSLLAAITGIAVIGICGELADTKSSGPGSFRINLIDELYNLKKDSIIKRLKF